MKRGASLLCWKIKVKLNHNKQLGVFFSPRALDEDGNVINGTNSNSLVSHNGYFSTALYNIKIESASNPVFRNQCSMYSFPLTENYFFGPSNIDESPNLVEYSRANGLSHYGVTIWLMECILHSSIMHYIGVNYSNLMEQCPIENLKLIEPKEFISFLECKRIINNVQPKQLLKIINRYSIIKKLSKNLQRDVLQTLSPYNFTPAVLKQFVSEAEAFNSEYHSNYHSIIFHPEFIKMLGSQRQRIIEAHEE